jgi:hypothetical protein
VGRSGRFAVEKSLLPRRETNPGRPGRIPSLYGMSYSDPFSAFQSGNTTRSIAISRMRSSAIHVYIDSLAV